MELSVNGKVLRCRSGTLMYFPGQSAEFGMDTLPVVIFPVIKDVLPANVTCL